MRAGQLFTALVIEQRTTVQDESGQPLDVWSTVLACRADLRGLSGLESIRADAPASIVKASARIRWCTGISAAMRVRTVDEGALYNITAVLPDARRRYVDLALERAS